MRMLKEKYRLIVVLSIILLLSFLFVGISAYIASRDAIRSGISQQALPLTADNIYSEIQKDLLRPVFISSMMAHDTFLRDWMIGGERDVSQMTRYLQEIHTEYAANTAFLVSERTRKHYVAKGVMKTVSEQDPRDKWYFRVRKMQAPYESNVDPDQANRDVPTVFINYRVYDYRGEYIGAAGVGLTLDKVGDHIDRYQNVFNRRIYFVDHSGKIVLGGKTMRGVSGSIRDIPGIKAIADQILGGGKAPLQLEYRQGESLVMVNSRYIPELDNYLLVEQDDRDDTKGVRRVLTINLAVGAVIVLLALMLIRRSIGRYQQRIERMTGEALAHAAKETEMAREQQEFVAMVSHEFRTPLAIIDSSLQGLRRHEQGMPDEVSSRYGRIRRATFRLNELIDNYLVEDRLEHSHFVCGTDSLDLVHLIERVAERIEYPYVNVDVDGQMAMVTGDAELLRIVFFNILSNAIKYSTPNMPIRVRARIVDEMAEVCVTDTGVGIAPVDLPRIFDKHFRVAGNKAAGSGLGLYITRRIVELHGGTIAVESEPGQGTTIRIRLPLACSV